MQFPTVSENLAIANQNQHQNLPLLSVIHCILHLYILFKLLNAFSIIFPKWEWNPNPDDYDACFNINPLPKLTSYASLSQDDWSTCLEFFCNVKWKVHQDDMTASVELAFLAHLSGYTFTVNTPAQLATLIRKVVNQLYKMKINLVPGSTCPKNKCVGKPLPAGRLLGAVPFISNEHRKIIALFTIKARGYGLKDWNIDF